jgi:hypothetical protein
MCATIGQQGSTEAPAVWFAYSPDRKADHPANHLATFRGWLQADAFPGFNRLYEQGGITEVACWAHYPDSAVIQSMGVGAAQSRINGERVSG